MMPPGGMPRPTREQIEQVSQQVLRMIEVNKQLIELKREKRRSIVMAAKAECGLLDIEITAAKEQLAQLNVALEQNKAHAEQVSSLIVKPPKGITL